MLSSVDITLKMMHITKRKKVIRYLNPNICPGKWKYTNAPVLFHSIRISVFLNLTRNMYQKWSNKTNKAKIVALTIQII
ncbi:hypothetical protein VNO78_22188 [Psophocarpus tetragonolobus]|uniref:Uncharacterized protein n=1 Tax=Psophocarpus tetragonolobus TaxID=3891 RepID=A0AAN9SD54_PSOTE